MYNGKNIDSMNFDELRSFAKVLYQKIEALEGLYARTKREYSDAINNITKDNISIELINEQEAAIAKTVSEQTTDILNGMVTLETKIAQNADAIELRASKEEVDALSETVITQTAEAINQVALKCLPIDALNSATEVSSVEDMDDEAVIYKITTHDPDVDNIKAEITTYYAYNNVLGKFLPILDGQSIYTVFTQTSDGFIFKGNVKIDASLIVKDTLYGFEYSDENGTAILKLSTTSSSGVYYPVMVYTDSSGNEILKVAFDSAGTVDFYLNGNKIGYVGVDKKFYAVGEWNFSNAVVEELGVVPVFG